MQNENVFNQPEIFWVNVIHQKIYQKKCKRFRQEAQRTLLYNLAFFSYKVSMKSWIPIKKEKKIKKLGTSGTNSPKYPAPIWEDPNTLQKLITRIPNFQAIQQWTKRWFPAPLFYGTDLS